MTKTQLEKLKGLPREIESLERELAGMEEQEEIGSIYKDYKTGYPKIKVQNWLEFCPVSRSEGAA